MAKHQKRFNRSMSIIFSLALFLWGMAFYTEYKNAEDQGQVNSKVERAESKQKRDQAINHQSKLPSFKTDTSLKKMGNKLEQPHSRQALTEITGLSRLKKKKIEKRLEEKLSRFREFPVSVSITKLKKDGNIIALIKSRPMAPGVPSTSFKALIQRKSYKVIKTWDHPIIMHRKKVSLSPQGVL